MKIDLANIAGTLGAHGRYTISEQATPTEACEPVGLVVGWLEVENTGSIMLVRGELRAVVRVSCVRCLVPCECPLVMEVEEQFATEDAESDVVTIDREEPEASAIKDFVLDVGELVRQQLLVNLPMAQLCREDCQGICPTCGQNLNLGPCACAVTLADPRWATLADVLGKQETGQDN